jgi:hypothetical protein
MGFTPVREPLDDPFLELWAKTRDEGLVPYILITANRLQMGKTKCSMRIGEKVMEHVEGRKWTPDLIGFDNPWFMETWQKVPEWTPLDLDEPNRPAGNRNWHSEENQALAEWLQTRAYEHRPSMFPLPHQHLLDNAIVGVCTSHIIVDYPHHAIMYEYLRDQLNRTFKTKTRYIGEMHFEDPYAWDWATYMKKRHEYTVSRGKMLEDKVRMIHNEGNRAVSPLSYDDILSIISANPADYSTNRGLSATTIMAKLKVPYNKAQRAAKEVMLSQKDMERAEKET